MSIRDQDLIERVVRAEKDLLDFKNSQAFGKDVTTPKVIQRYNSDGTPTQWDIVGTYNNSFGPGFDEWRFHALITYKAFHQKSPWAIVYANIQVNPSNTILSVDASSFNAFYYPADDLFDEQGRIRFDVTGATGPGYGSNLDASIDRLYVKILILATDDGTMNIQVPFSTNPTGNNGTGTLVPLA